MEQTVIFLHESFMRSTQLLMDGLSAFAAERGWRVQRMTPPRGAGVDYLHRIVEFWNPVGIVKECAFSRAMPIPDGTLKVPFVCTDLDPSLQSELSAARKRIARIGFVNSDAETLAEMAARELLKRDFASYAFVTAYRRYHWSERRCAAFRRAIELNGERMHKFNGLNMETVNDASMRRVEKWLLSLPKPCGMLAANDRTASIVITAASRCGVAVPDEVSIIGIDDFESLCENMSPPLTSIQLDFFTGGCEAGKLLETLAASKAPCTATALYGATRIVNRLSLRKLNRSAPSVKIALETIRRRATEGISASDILPILGGSRRSAEKRFLAATGKSILEEIIDVRFERLLPLLEKKEVSLGLLAERTGFTSSNQLQRQFKARYGKTLSAWRKSLVSQ